MLDDDNLIHKDEQNLSSNNKKCQENLESVECLNNQDDTSNIVVNGLNEYNEIADNIKRCSSNENLQNIAVVKDFDVKELNCSNSEDSDVQSETSQKDKECDKYKNLSYEYFLKIQNLQTLSSNQEELIKELQEKVEILTKKKESALKEKENMVIKYAIGEKNILKEKQLREKTEKKCNELNKENEICQHKIQSLVNEKARICQLLDNKVYEHKNLQQEFDKMKADLQALENKLKWNQTNLKTEIEMNKENQEKIDMLNRKLYEATEQMEQVKKEAQESIKSFKYSQENQAHVLDVQVKEQQATLILLRHEKDDKSKQLKLLQGSLERLQEKHEDTLQENNELSLKIQQLERERLESQQKLSELRGCADQQLQDVADLQMKTSQLEQFKLQLKNEQEQLKACKEQINNLKTRNADLESDMEACRAREAELLVFTQQLTDKNVRLQSEFTSMETKVQQLSCEQTKLQRAMKEQETKASMLLSQLTEERAKHIEEIDSLHKQLSEQISTNARLKQELMDQQGENSVIKRKQELALREVQKELNQCRKKIEAYESNGTTSSSSSDLSINGALDKPNEAYVDQVKVIQPDNIIDRQALIEHIVKLQRISAKKSEKIDFLEEHVNTLVMELQKKSRLLQGYILREQTGALTSNKMDTNKAKLAKLNGVMASMYSSRVADEHLTLELSLDINRKLQAVLEDALLKNITLKENVDTLGAEIDRLNKLVKN